MMDFKNVQVSLQNSNMGEGISNFQSDMPENINLFKIIKFFFVFLYKFITSKNDYDEMKFIIIRDSKDDSFKLNNQGRKIANVRLSLQVITSEKHLINLQLQKQFLSENNILIESISYNDNSCKLLLFGSSLDKILKSMYEVDKICNFETKKEYTSYFSYGQTYFDKQ